LIYPLFCKAKAIGFVDEIFPQDEVMAKALDYAHTISKGATFGMRRIKKCINRDFETSFEKSTRLECDSQAEVFETRDFKKESKLCRKVAFKRTNEPTMKEQS